MKRLKKVFISVCAVTVLGFVALMGLDLEKTGDRPFGDAPLSGEIEYKVNQAIATAEKPEDVIEACADVATECLKFAASNDLRHGSANCVGYAQLTSGLLNHAFRAKGMPFKAKPVVGVVTCWGVDMCAVAQHVLPESIRPFFKDHDWVEVQGDSSCWYVDTSLRDLAWRSFVIEKTP